MILVVGATGEVGSAVVRSLRASGHPVRALVRASTDATPITQVGGEVVRGDLLDPRTLDGACDGVDVIVATASAIVPRRGETADFAALGRGYAALGRTAATAGVERFVFLSVPSNYMGRGALEFDVKAQIEVALAATGLRLTIVRAALFMESWLPAAGSRLPVRDAPGSAIDRGYWLTRAVAATVQTSIDRFGVAILPGGNAARHAFISSGDVAEALAALAREPADAPAEGALGGPAALSWADVADAYSAVLGRRLRRVRVPGAPLRLLAALARHVSDAAGHLLAVQHLISTQDSDFPSTDAARLLGRPPESVLAFLTRKNAAASGQAKESPRDAWRRDDAGIRSSP